MTKTITSLLSLAVLLLAPACGGTEADPEQDAQGGDDQAEPADDGGQDESADDGGQAPITNGDAITEPVNEGNGDEPDVPTIDVVGMYAMDASVSLAQTDFSQFDQRQAAGVRNFLTGMASELNLEEGGTLIGFREMMGRRMEMSGTWELNGTDLLLRQSVENGSERVDEVKMTVEDGNLVMLQDTTPGGPVMKIVYVPKQ